MQKEPVLKENNNLNTLVKKSLKYPPLRNKGSRFRRHPLRTEILLLHCLIIQLTATIKKLVNGLLPYNMENGDGFPLIILDDFYKQLENIITHYKNGNKFIWKL